MADLQNTPRCAWCGLIRDATGWRIERRKRSIAYRWGFCPLCNALEGRDLVARIKKAHHGSTYGASQAFDKWVKERWRR